MERRTRINKLIYPGIINFSLAHVVQDYLQLLKYYIFRFIIVGNVFVIFVFWKHRNKLKRASFLLINLAVTDLLVGFTEPIALGPFDILEHLKETSFNNARNTNISTAFQVAFSCASVFW